MLIWTEWKGENLYSQKVQSSKHLLGVMGQTSENQDAEAT